MLALTNSSASGSNEKSTNYVEHLINIAVVEDEHSLRNDLCDFLAVRGFAVSAHRTAEEFYSAYAMAPCDLVLLDIHLPGDSGLVAAQWLRARSGCGIVMLTALNSSIDHVAGLGAGADAYLVKHTALEVIEATCRSVLRRLSQASSDAAPVNTATSNDSSTLVPWQLLCHRWLLLAPNGSMISLTHSELIFLQCVMSAFGKAVARKEILLALGKPDTLSNQRNLENYASRLRRKVQQSCATELPIRTSYNQGYTFASTAFVQQS